MTLDEQRVRELWEEQLRREIECDEFAAMRAVYGAVFGTGEPEPLVFDTPASALNALENIILQMRISVGSEPEEDERRGRLRLEPPRGWASYTKQGLAREYESGARAVREAFRLAAPVAPEDVPKLLKAAEKEQRWPSRPCDVGRIPYLLDAQDTAWQRQHVRVYLESPRFAHDPYSWERRLHGLWLMIEGIHEDTGLDRLGALYFILCGAEPNAPWLETRTRPLTGGGSVWMQITVGSLAALPAEVAALYARAREEALAQPLPHDWPMFERVPAAAEELVSFCEKHLAEGLTWSEIARAWNEEHPAREYKSGDVLGRTYRRYTGKQPKRGRAS